MKLYLISQEENNGYDTYDSAVVAAASEAEAKRIDPSGFRRWDSIKEAWMFRYADGTEKPEGKYDFNSWVSHPDNVKAEYIGESARVEAGLVLASFNAG